MLAWAVILLTVAFIIAIRVMPELRGHAGTESGAVGVDLQLEIAAKGAVGAKAMKPETVEPLMPALDRLAKGPGQKLIVAVIAGELQGSAAALQRLDAIEPAGGQDQRLSGDISALRSIYERGPDSLDEADRARLTKNLGYAGKLALSHDRPDTDPLRQSVLAEGKRAAWTVLAAEAVLLVFGVSGLVLLVIAIVLLSTGTIRRHYKPAGGEGNVYVCMFAVYLVSYIALSLLVSLLWHSESSPLAGSLFLVLVLPIAFAFGRLCGQSWPDMRRALGWHSGRGWYVEMPLGIVGYIAGLPVVVIGFLITMLLMKYSTTTPSHPVLEMPLDTPWQILQLYLLACVLAPLIEETMFRGALFHHMRRRWNWPISAGVVALLFAAIHPQGWTTIPVLGSIAIVLAALREWRGSILPAMVAHACNNFLVVSLLVALK